MQNYKHAENENKEYVHDQCRAINNKSMNLLTI